MQASNRLHHNAGTCLCHSKHGQHSGNNRKNANNKSLKDFEKFHTSMSQVGGKRLPFDELRQEAF